MKKQVKTVYEFFDGDIVVSTQVKTWIALRYNGLWRHSDSRHSAGMSDGEVQRRMDEGIYEYVANRYGHDEGENSSDW